MRAAVVARCGGVLLAVAALQGVSGCAASAPRPAPPQASVPLDSWQDGDILVSGGAGWRGWLVRSTDSLHTPFTHAGLILIEGGVPMLLHASPGDDAHIAVMPLADYLALPELRSVAIYRARDARYAPPASAEARRYLAAKVAFDREYDATSDATLYCTEMIWRSYLNVGLDLLGRPRRALRAAPLYGPLIWPSDFTTMPDLRLVHSTEAEQFWQPPAEPATPP